MLRERQHRLLYLASAARVGPRQFADLDALLDECVDVLDAPTKPEVYVTQSPVVNAYTIGMDAPFIVITSGLYDLMTHDELRFVVGHELGHALSGHATYRTMLMHLMRLGGSLGFLPIGGWRYARSWRRCWNGNASPSCPGTGGTALLPGLGHRDSGGDEAGRRKPVGQAGLRSVLGPGRGVRAIWGHARRAAQAAQPRTSDPPVLGAAGRRIDQVGGRRRLWKGDVGSYPLRVDDGQSSIADDLGEAARHYKDGFDQSDDPLIKGIRDGLGGIVDGVGRAATSAPIRWAARSTSGAQPEIADPATRFGRIRLRWVR
ncbi:peptidase M48 family protein [Mycobacterium ulcerans str. Harvey]|uniref:Peptidase M48 family protein n=1 Tax=Mycobacterium ulcerans str. Harvey TaxID=1299332 RepID=A0ABN0QWA6_MYCUL|nr:peptidase M48 family protein [Mycobacterium ulcerans str. Harvey]